MEIKNDVREFSFDSWAARRKLRHAMTIKPQTKSLDLRGKMRRRVSWRLVTNPYGGVISVWGAEFL